MRVSKYSIIAISIVLLSSFSFSVNAQQNWCGKAEMTQKYMDEHPEEVQSILDTEEQLNQFTQNYTQSGARAVKIIPIVFHVIHINGTENISKTQVEDQVRILNEDYSATNDDLSDVVSSFTSRIGDSKIEFRLAQIDPQGNPTDGIDRIYSTKTNQGGDAAKLNPWPRSKYLNVWVVKSWNSSIPNGVLAYAYLPSMVHNSPNIDGIIMLSRFVGSIGTSSPYYSRTLTHEIGHYLNLEHTWGGSNNPGSSANCNSDDGVSDTPNTVGSSSCNVNYVSCGSLDNVQNQMEYSFCSVMFTKGQSSRMNATLNSGVSQRNQLSTATNLAATGVSLLTEANFVANRFTICQGESVDFSDKSKYDATSWSWIFPSGQANSNTNKNPEVLYEQPGLYDVTLNASNGTQNVSHAKVGYIMVNPVIGKHVPYSEDFSSVTSLNHENWYANNVEQDAYFFTPDNTSGYNGSSCIKLNNFGNANKTFDELITTTYDLSIFSSSSISFDVAYAKTGGLDLSKLSVYISNDCGQSWGLKWVGTSTSIATGPTANAPFTPSGNTQWKTINLPTLPGSILTQNSQIKIVFENKSGNNLYIDNFNITGVYSDNAQLKYPEDGRTALPNNQILYWKATGDIDSYEYQLDTDPGFNTGNLQTGINTAISTVEGPDTRFETSGLSNGQTYYWRVRLIKNGQEKAWSDTWSFTVALDGVSTQDILLEKYEVKVYPNPMKEEGIISFKLDKGAQVSVSVLDVMGKERLLINQSYLGTGTHVYNLTHPNLPTGVYVIRINVDGVNIYKKIVLN